MEIKIRNFGLFETSNILTYSFKEELESKRGLVSFLRGLDSCWFSTENPSSFDLDVEKRWLNLPIFEVSSELVKEEEWLFFIPSLSLIGSNSIKGGGLNRNSYVVLFTQAGRDVYPSALLKTIK